MISRSRAAFASIVATTLATVGLGGGSTHAAAPEPAWQASYTSSASDVPGSLRAIVALGPDRALAAGFRTPHQRPGLSGPTTPVLLRWNGSRWAPWKHQLNPSLGAGAIWSMNATSNQNVWVNAVHAGWLHWNGTRWSKPKLHGTAVPGDASILASTHTWIAGTIGSPESDTGLKTVVVSYRPKHPKHPWRQVLSIPDTFFGGATVQTDRDAWIVGSGASASSSFSLHWNGKAWHHVPTPKVNCALAAVAAKSADDALAVGQTSGTTPTQCAERWNGRRWRMAAAPDTQGVRLDAITTGTRDTYWAAGLQPQSDSQAPQYFQFRNGSWRNATGPSRTFPGATTQQIWVTSLSHAVGSATVLSAGDLENLDCETTTSCSGPPSGEMLVDVRP